jgi:hypothetical protein
MTNKASNEYQNFDNKKRRLISVPHSEIKAKLDAEKRAKGMKPKRKRNPKRND